MAAGANVLNFMEGDAVLLNDGTEGTIVKFAGPSKVIVKVGNLSRIRNLTQCKRPAAAKPPPAAPRGPSAGPPNSYSIVGTWDEWTPRDMQWNSEGGCFEFTVTVTTDLGECFKFLVDGDWTSCVYPSHGYATCHDGHCICGPDDGGLEEAWSLVAADGNPTEEGDRYTVRLFFLPDGRPARVNWQQWLPPKPESERREPSVPREELGSSEPDQAPDPNLSPRPEDSADAAVNDDAPSLTEAMTALGPIETERVARMRLAHRLSNAAMVADGGQAGWEAEEEAARRARNMRRYDNDSPDSLLDPGYSRRPKPQPKPAERRPVRSKCAECHRWTETVWSVGTYCCEVCMEDFNDLVLEGWRGDALVDGTPAAERVKDLMEKFQWSPQESRIALMRLYPESFRQFQALAN